MAALRWFRGDDVCKHDLGVVCTFPFVFGTSLPRYGGVFGVCAENCGWVVRWEYQCRMSLVRCIWLAVLRCLFQIAFRFKTVFIFDVPHAPALARVCSVDFGVYDSGQIVVVFRLVR